MPFFLCVFHSARNSYIIKFLMKTAVGVSHACEILDMFLIFRPFIHYAVELQFFTTEVEAEISIFPLEP